MVFEHEEGEVTVEEGDFFLMPAFAPHRWRVLTGGTTLHGFMLSLRPAADRADSLVPRLPHAAAHLGYHLPPEPAASVALRHAEDESRRGDALGVVAAGACIRLALALLFRRIVSAAPSEASQSHIDPPATLSPTLEHAVAFIIDHMTDPLDAASVARHVHLSRRQLDRLFDTTFGMSADAFMRHTRLERARHLLGGTDLSIKQIAYACGFADPNYFGRIFRKRHGQSPGAYRRHSHGEHGGH
jgi:AraC-like DNA-binding protein